MLSVFNGGEVQTELVGSDVYFRASDLMETAGIPISTPPYKDVRLRADINFRNDLGPKQKGAQNKYVKLSEAFDFLDAVHVNTRPETMMLMSEIASQFETQLYPE